MISQTKKLESDYLIKSEGFGLMRVLKKKSRSELYELIFELVDELQNKERN